MPSTMKKGAALKKGGSVKKYREGGGVAGPTRPSAEPPRGPTASRTQRQMTPARQQIVNQRMQQAVARQEAGQGIGRFSTAGQPMPRPAGMISGPGGMAGGMAGGLGGPGGLGGMAGGLGGMAGPRTGGMSSSGPLGPLDSMSSVNTTTQADMMGRRGTGGNPLAGGMGGLAAAMGRPSAFKKGGAVKKGVMYQEGGSVSRAAPELTADEILGTGGDYMERAPRRGGLRSGRANANRRMEGLRAAEKGNRALADTGDMGGYAYKKGGMVKKKAGGVVKKAMGGMVGKGCK